MGFLTGDEDGYGGDPSFSIKADLKEARDLLLQVMTTQNLASLKIDIRAFLQRTKL